MGLMVDRICAIGRSSGQMTVEFVAALPVLFGGGGHLGQRPDVFRLVCGVR